MSPIPCNFSYTIRAFDKVLISFDNNIQGFANKKLQISDAIKSNLSSIFVQISIHLWQPVFVSSLISMVDGHTIFKGFSIFLNSKFPTPLVLATVTVTKNGK